jgi:hypothetical protein
MLDVIRSLLEEWRSGFAAMAPGRFPYARFGLAVVIGTAGGLTFNHFHLPLAWMMGPWCSACWLP